MKKCARCGAMKSEREFFRLASGNLRKECKACRREYVQRWNHDEENVDAILADYFAYIKKKYPEGGEEWSRS